MGKKKKKIITAGKLVMAAVYTPPMPRDEDHVRAAKRKVSTEARKLMNLKTAKRRLELLLACNFTEKDIHLTLTYDDKHLPTDRKTALKCLRKFLAQMRNHYKARGLQFKYIYVTEGQHGDKRFHHHIVINAIGNDAELVRSLWVYGQQVDLEPIADREYEELAAYITKEPTEAGKPNGAQLWTGSRNLDKPKIETFWIDENETLCPPAGCFVLERREGQNEFSAYSFIKYRIPTPKPRKTRPARHKKAA